MWEVPSFREPTGKNEAGFPFWKTLQHTNQPGGGGVRLFQRAKAKNKRAEHEPRRGCDGCYGFKQNLLAELKKGTGRCPNCDGQSLEASKPRPSTHESTAPSRAKERRSRRNPPPPANWVERFWGLLFYGKKEKVCLAPWVKIRIFFWIRFERSAESAWRFACLGNTS